MISLSTLLAICPPPPRPRSPEDFAIALPRKLDDWRWEDVTTEEVRADFAALMSPLRQHHGMQVLVDGVPLRADIMDAMVAAGGGTITLPNGQTATVTCTTPL